jgi:hypothetical protein
MLGFTTLHDWLLFRVGEGLTFIAQQRNETQGSRNMKFKEMKLQICETKMATDSA